MPTKSIDEILEDRGKTHGDFAVHAMCTQQMKNSVRTNSAGVPLSSMQREALDMILHKVGRIVAGDPNTKDHWDDIIGYATLVSRDIDKTE